MGNESLDGNEIKLQIPMANDNHKETVFNQKNIIPVYI